VRAYSKTVFQNVCQALLKHALETLEILATSWYLLKHSWNVLLSLETLETLDTLETALEMLEIESRLIYPTLLHVCQTRDINFC